MANSKEQHSVCESCADGVAEDVNKILDHLNSSGRHYCGAFIVYFHHDAEGTVTSSALCSTDDDLADEFVSDAIAKNLTRFLGRGRTAA
jgi:hypothetical protein